MSEFKDVWDNSDNLASVGEAADQQQQHGHLSDDQLIKLARASVRASAALGESMVNLLQTMNDMGAGTIQVGAQLHVKDVGPYWFKFSVGVSNDD